MQRETLPPSHPCGDADGGHEVDGKAVIAGCDTPEVFETSEHALDGIAVAV
jgi:hypothetical protein